MAKTGAIWGHGEGIIQMNFDFPLGFGSYNLHMPPTSLRPSSSTCHHSTRRRLREITNTRVMAVVAPTLTGMARK